MSDVIKIQLGERVRECKENDFAVFEKQGYTRVAEKKAAKKRAPRKPKVELIAPAAAEVSDGNDD